MSFNMLSFFGVLPFHCSFRQATPQRAALEDTQPATESQVERSLGGSPPLLPDETADTGKVQSAGHSPTSPQSSLPSSASKTESEEAVC